MMSKETISILVIVGVAIFVWLPAIVISVLRALRDEKENQNNKQ